MMVLPSIKDREEMDIMRPWLREDMSVDYIKRDIADDAPENVKEIYERWKRDGHFKSES